MDEIKNTVERAIAAGEVITIKYHGGSQPGKERQIAPISVSGAKARARCFASNTVKVFMLAKNEVLDSHRPEEKAAWTPGAKPETKYNSILDIYSENLAAFESAGWHINFSDDCLSLHKKFKNGNPMKGPEVSITYSEWTYDEWVDQNEDGELVHMKENKRKSSRPYHVYAKKKNGSSFGKLDKAAERFLELAMELAPK